MIGSKLLGSFLLITNSLYFIDLSGFIKHSTALLFFEGLKYLILKKKLNYILVK